jgi:outer membrane protein TolC
MRPSRHLLKARCRRVPLALALALAGCATYQPLSLPDHAQLAASASALRHTLPAAEAGARPITLDVSQALTPKQIGLLAILNAPELLTERGEFETAQAGVVQSGPLPNPSMNIGYAALVGGPGIAGAWTASLAQDVASLVTYKSRVAAAETHVRQVNADLLWKEWQVAQKARLLAVGIYWNDQTLALSKKQLATLTRTTDEVQHAVDQHNATLPDLTPLLAAKAALEQSIATLALQQLKNWADLNALLGLTPAARLTIAAPAEPALPADLDALAASVPERRPDLVALQLGYRSADESVRSAILGQFPALALGGTWATDTSKVRTAGPTVTFDVPIFRRNQDQIALTQATRLLLREQYQIRLDTAEAAIRGLRTRIGAITAQLKSAERDAATAAQQAQVAHQAFEHGNIDARTLTDYESTVSSRSQTVFDLRRALDEAYVGLDLELGLGLPQTRIAPLDSTEPS